MSRPALHALAMPAVIAWVCAGGAAVARQTAQPAPNSQPPVPAPPTDATAPGVVVTAKSQDYKTSIDRKSYSLANDLQTASGSLADVLRNLPSVQVDPDGNVSLRGDASVTILIDGKPSALLSGPNRADALLALPADQFERVEVMTTPSAEYKAEGTGGIINLVSRKGARSAKTSGSMSANAGTAGRYNGSLNLAYNAQGLSVTGGASFRHSVSGRDEITILQLQDPTTGALVPARLTDVSSYEANTATANTAIDYDVDARTRLSATVTLVENRFQTPGSGAYLSDALSGPLELGYDDTARLSGRYASDAAAFSYLRKLPGEGHEISLALNVNSVHDESSAATSYLYLAPALPDLFQDLVVMSDNREVQVTAQYKTPLPNKAELVAGYEFQLDIDRNGNLEQTGTSANDATPSPSLSSIFKFYQQVHALYATYEQAFGEFTLKPGLRLEETVIAADLVTTHVEGGQTYFQAYPSFHFSYDIDDRQQLKLSYGRRVRRPDVESLNPFRVEITPISFEQGNPDLKPQITESFELGYEYHKQDVDYQATLYLRDNKGLFTTITRSLGGSVLLTTNENLGDNLNGGLELVANRPLTRTLSINASGNLFVSEVDAANLGILQTRSALLASGRASLNWQANKQDFVQFSTAYNGRRLTAQGYTDSFASLNLGWRHKFDDRLASIVRVQDPFNYRVRTIIDTATLKENENALYRFRALFVGLTYAFGGPGKSVNKDFDFGGS